MTNPEHSLISDLMIHEMTDHLQLAQPLTFKMFPISSLDPFGVRDRIRAQLVEGIEDTIGGLSPNMRETLLDVRQRPTFPDFTYSISHAGNLAAYAILPETRAGLGIDLESSARVTDRVCSRVCESSLEVASSPSPALLWTAKEASFKALSHFCIRNGLVSEAPATISQVEISNWCNLSDHIWSYQFNLRTKTDTRLAGRGAATESENLSLSIAISI